MCIKAEKCIFLAFYDEIIEKWNVIEAIVSQK